MKTIIAGSRTIDNMDMLVKAVQESNFNISSVISGMARGVDSLAVQYADERKIPLVKMPAMWDLHGKSAGYKRNQQMANVADALIALWDGTSRGTKHMIDIAIDKGLMVFVYRTDK